MTFAEVVNALAAELRKPVVVEGAPVRYSDVAPRVEAVLRQSMAPRQRLDEIARLLDYSVIADSEGFLLAKNYTSSREVVCISFEELYAFYKDLMVACKPYSPPLWVPGDVPPTMRGKQEFLRCLSPEQWNQSCGEGLLVAQLSPDQTRILTRVLLNSYIGGHYTHLTQVLPALEGARKGTFTFSSKEDRSRGGSYTIGSDGTTRTRTSSGNNSVITLHWKNSWGAAGATLIPGTLPPSSALGTPRTPHFFEGESTMDELQKRLNASPAPAASGQQQPRCEYDPCLGDKPVVYSGGRVPLTSISARRLVSRLYGLRTEARLGGYRLLPRRMPRQFAPDEFRDAVLEAAMPLPLRRALLPPPLSEAEVREKIKETIARREMPRPLSGWRSGEVQEGAERFLVASLGGRLQERKGKPIAFADASPREKAALGLWLSRQYLAWCAAHLQEVPAYIREFPRLRIECRQYQDQKGRAMAAIVLNAPPNERARERANRPGSGPPKWQMAIAWADVWDIARP